MSFEADLRQALLAHAPLVAVVPAARISVDLVEQGVDRPYIVLNKQREEPDQGLDNTVFGTDYTFDVQVVGTTRANAIQVKDLVRAALRAAGIPPDEGVGAYDPDFDLEVETITVNHYESAEF